MTSKTESTPTAPAEAGDCGRSSLAHGSAQSADTPPPAKEGWQHSDMVLVWYPGAPEAGKTDRFGIAYYHYNPPFEDARWIDWDHPGRAPRWWWPLPSPPND